MQPAIQTAVAAGLSDAIQAAGDTGNIAELDSAVQSVAAAYEAGQISREQLYQLLKDVQAARV